MRNYALSVSAIVLIAASLLVVSCDNSTGIGAANEAKGGLTGHAYLAESRKPIYGVVVFCGDQVDTTGKSGRFLLNGISEGARALSAQHELYEPYQTTIVIRGDITDSLDIFLTLKAVSRRIRH